MLKIQTFVLVILVRCVSNFEIILNRIKEENSTNKSFEIPLYERRNLTIRIDSNEFNRRDIIGLKYRIQTTILNVIQIKQQTNREENWFIYKSPRQIFNLYPSPKIFYSMKENQSWLIESQMMDSTRLNIRLDVFYNDRRRFTLRKSVEIIVTHPRRPIDRIFYIFGLSVVIGTSILTGIVLDMDVILGFFERPRPILIGFVARYGLMPFLGMTTAKLFQYTSLNTLVLFIIGCCPGSTFSNQWTIIFEGDINLSATMSCLFTCTSFIMIPIYFHTIGRVYTHDLPLRIPYSSLGCLLAITIIPYVIGILINYFSWQVKFIIEKNIRWIFISIMLFLFLFAIIVNWYAFQMIDLYTILTLPFVPLFAFIFSGLLASMSEIHWREMKTISIETGIQNTSIGFVILMYSLFPSKVFVLPMILALLTMILLWSFVLVRKRIRKQ